MGIIMVYKPTNTDWWFGTMEFLMTFHSAVGMSSSQLTKSMIFQRGGSTTNQMKNNGNFMEFHQEKL